MILVLLILKIDGTSKHIRKFLSKFEKIRRILKHNVACALLGILTKFLVDHYIMNHYGG